MNILNLDCHFKLLLTCSCLFNRDAPKCITRIVLTISKKLNEEKKETLKRTLQELQYVETDINSRL